jgi:hypothetical protein
MRTFRSLIMVAAATALTALAAQAWAEDDTRASREPKGPWHDWKTLHLRARPLFLFSGQVEMTLREADEKKLLMTSTKASFLGATLARSRTVTTLDAATGRTLEYHQLSMKRGRRYRFGESSYTVEKLRPANGPDAPLETWEVRSTKEYPYPAKPEGGPAPQVFDYYGMILHLRHVELREPGDAVTLYVATSDGPKPFRIEVSEQRSSERVFLDIATDKRRKEPVHELRLRVSPGDPASAEEGFLKMEGETEIWVEAETRTLLEIDGKIPRVPGRVELALAALE